MLQDKVVPHEMVGIQNNHEHSIILNEMKGIRQDLKDLMQLTSNEMKVQHRELNTMINELKEDFNEQKIKMATLENNDEGIRKTIYMVAAPTFFVAVSAMAKAMGFI